MSTQTQENTTRDRTDKDNAVNSTAIQVDSAWQPLLNRDKTTNKQATTTVKPTKEVATRAHDKKNKELRLTRKQKAFADYLLENPKASGAEAARQVYNLSNPQGSTARVIATENIAKPNIQAYMNKHIDRAREVSIEIMENANKRKDNPRFQELAALQVERIYDRVIGKPVTKSISGQVNTLEQLLQQ